MKGEFKSLLPNVHMPLEKALEEAVFNRKVKSGKNIWDAGSVDIKNVWDVEKISGNLLSYLAWGLGVEIWSDDETITVEQKRDLTRYYITVRKCRGTRKSIELVCSYLGIDVKDPEKFRIEENPEAGDSFKVRIIIKAQEDKISQERAIEARRVIDLLKPVRVEASFGVEYDAHERVGALSTLSISRFYDVFCEVK